MNGEKRGRDIQDRTFRFALRVVRLCDLLDRKPGVGRAIARQLIRSGTSIGANLEEAQASRSPADFVATCAIACREARETHYWLRMIAGAGIIPESRISDLIDEGNQIVAILTSIINNTRRHNSRADF